MSRSFPRVAVLISGGGTTLQNLIDEIAAGSLAVEIALVVSSRADAYGLVRARTAGLTTIVIEPKPAADFSERIFTDARRVAVDLVLCAGWLKRLTIPADFHRRVLNIHPSLLPDFGGKGMYGKHVHEAVLAAKRTVSGCTVHYVDDEYDHGPILLQREADIADCTTADEIAARVFDVEKHAYPEAIRLALGMTTS